MYINTYCRKKSCIMSRDGKTSSARNETMGRIYTVQQNSLSA